jgi:hypothetical protein
VQVAPQSSTAVTAHLSLADVAADPASRRARYIQLAGLPCHSRSADGCLELDGSAEESVASPQTSIRCWTASADDQTGRCTCHDNDGGRCMTSQSNGRSVCSPSFPIFRRQLSATSAELESVERTNIVSTVKKIFEEKSRASAAVREDETRRHPVTRRSRSASAVESVRSRDLHSDDDYVLANGTARSGADADLPVQPTTRRRLDFREGRQSFETQAQSSTTSGVSSVSSAIESSTASDESRPSTSSQRASRIDQYRRGDVASNVAARSSVAALDKASLARSRSTTPTPLTAAATGNVNSRSIDDRKYDAKVGSCTCS